MRGLPLFQESLGVSRRSHIRSGALSSQPAARRVSRPLLLGAAAKSAFPWDRVS